MAKENQLRIPSSVLRVFGIEREVAKPKSSSEPDQPNFSNAYSWMQSRLEVSDDRLKRYKDYDEMDLEVEVSSALDLYAEEATQFNSERNATVWAESDNKDLERSLNAALTRINAEELIYAIARSTAKYGDTFTRLYYAVGEGVRRILYVPPSTVSRQETETGTLVGFDEAGKKRLGGPSWKPWDMIHWRQTGKRIASTYGDSSIENARRIYKRLAMAEDAVSLYRLKMAPDRLIFYVDVQNASPEQAYDAVNKFRKKHKKNTFFNPVTGEVSITRNPMAVDEDIFWPVRKDSGSKVEKLAGSGNMGDITDLEYFRDKLYASLRLPKGMLGGEMGPMGFEPKQTLSAQDLRFSRVVKRLQRSLVVGFGRLLAIDHALVNDSVIRLGKDFTVHLSVVNVLDEMQRLEVVTSRLNTAQVFTQLVDTLGLDPDVTKRYVLVNILGLAPKDADNLIGGKAKVPNDSALALTASVDDDPSEKVKQLFESDPELRAKVTMAARKLLLDSSLDLEERVKDDGYELPTRSTTKVKK